MKRAIWLIVAIGLVVGGYRFYDNMSINPPLESDDKTGWLTTEGTVTNINYKKFPGGLPGEMTIYYRYVLEDKVYEYDTFYRSHEDREAQLTLQEHRVGSKITVCYDPAKPKRSYVIRPNSNAIY